MGCRILIAFLSLFSLFGCFTAGEVSSEDRKSAFTDLLVPFFNSQPPIEGAVGLHEAIARALKYNLDITQTHIDSQMAWLDSVIATQGYWPAIKASREDSYRKKPSQRLEYNPFGNFYEVNRVKNYSESWYNHIVVSIDMLSLAKTYLDTRITSNTFLIAEQKEKEAIWRITRDIVVSYYPAAMALKLTPAVEKLRLDIESALQSLRAESIQNNIPMESLNLERDLLQLKDEVNKKYTTFLGHWEHLAQTMGINPDLRSNLEGNDGYIPLLSVDFQQMDRNAFVNRPEIATAVAEGRINRDKVYENILSLFPSLSLSKDFTRSGDQTYVDNHWDSLSMSLSWDLVRLASLQSLLKKKDIVNQINEIRQTIVGMSIMMSNRLTLMNYYYTLDRYTSSLEISFLEKRFLDSIEAGSVGNLATKTQLDQLQARMNYLTALMDRAAAYSSLQEASMEMLRTQGLMIVPSGFNNYDLKDLIYTLKTSLENNTYTTPITRDTPLNSFANSRFAPMLSLIQESWKKDPEYVLPMITLGKTNLTTAGPTPFAPFETGPVLRSSQTPVGIAAPAASQGPKTLTHSELSQLPTAPNEVPGAQLPETSTQTIISFIQSSAAAHVLNPMERQRLVSELNAYEAKGTPFSEEGSRLLNRILQSMY